MFKNMLISLIFLVVSTASTSVFATVDDTVSSVGMSDNQIVLAEVSDSGFDKTTTTASKSQSLLLEKSESTLSTEWLFAIALFWFVMLSNRRGI